MGKEAILAEIEKKALKSKSSKEQLGGISQSLKPKDSSLNKPSRQSEDLIIYLLSKKESEIYKNIRDNIEVSDISDEVRKNLVLKLYDMYETGEINTKSIDSICSNDDEFSVLTGILMNGNVNDDTSKILSEVIKSFQLNKLKYRKDELIKKISDSKTEEERKLLESELNEVITKLGQLMIR